MSAEKEKNKPFSDYFKILYNKRINKGIKSKRFMIYLLNDFALDQEVIQDTIKVIFDKNETAIDINKLTNENDIPAIFSKYISGARNLSQALVTACSETRGNIDNVRNRIKQFLKNNISKEKQDLVVNQIQALFKELDLPDETLLKLDQLIQNKKIPDYFCKTFQIVLTAKFKQNELNSKTIENSELSMDKKDISTDKNKRKVASQNELQPEKMSDIFEQNIQAFNIIGFIDINPVNSLASYLLEDTDMFINRLKYHQERENILDKNEEIYQKTKEFVDLLFEYFIYLKQQMKVLSTFENNSPNCFKECYEPPKDDSGEFENTTLNFRQRLKSLYKEISSKLSQSGRRLAINCLADLPHHRTYRSVYGGSLVYVSDFSVVIREE